MKNNWKEDFDKQFSSLSEIHHDILGDCDVRVKNFIESLLAEQKKELLDLVEKEIDNKRALDSEILAASGNNDEESRDRIKVFDDISTIINNLRV